MDDAKEYLDDLAVVRGKLQSGELSVEQVVRDYVWAKYQDQREERANNLVQACHLRTRMLAADPFVSAFNSPQLRSIDEQMHEAYDAGLKEFCTVYGYEFTRALENSFNCPHRRLHRWSADTRIRYTIAVQVAVDMLKRLEHGWYPKLPMEVLAWAATRGGSGYVIKELLVENCPFVELGVETLRNALERGVAKHAIWTEQYLQDHGEFISHSGGK